MKAIYKRVGFDPVQVEVENELEPLQIMIGGDIIAHPLWARQAPAGDCRGRRRIYSA